MPPLTHQSPLSLNHQSDESVSSTTFASSFLGEQGLHVAGLPGPVAEPVLLGDCAFHLLPYADPTAARFALGDEAIRTHQDVLAGQPAEYLLTQEKWYASGKRKYSMKADAAHKGMSDADREAVAHFLASQDIKPAETAGKKRRRQ